MKRSQSLEVSEGEARVILKYWDAWRYFELENDFHSQRNRVPRGKFYRNFYSKWLDNLVWVRVVEDLEATGSDYVSELMSKLGQGRSDEEVLESLFLLMGKSVPQDRKPIFDTF